MSQRSYRLVDLGGQRVLTVSGREYPTRYSERVLRLLIERKGIRRTPPYLTCKETRGPRYLGPLFAYLGARGVRGLRVLEVGCSFGHLTEYLAEQPEVTELRTFDTDRTFVEIVRAKVDELRLRAVREVLLFTNDGTRRLRWADGAFDLVLAVGVVEHLPLASRRAQVASTTACSRRAATSRSSLPNHVHDLVYNGGLGGIFNWPGTDTAYRFARRSMVCAGGASPTFRSTPQRGSAPLSVFSGLTTAAAPGACSMLRSGSARADSGRSWRSSSSRCSGVRSRRDLLCRRRLQLLDRLGGNRGWLRELSGYYRGLAIQEFWVRYTLGRMDAATLWARKPRSTEADYRSFYAETDYFVLRQMYYHRNDCYHWIARTLRHARREGDFCEYGCGVSPITAWLRPRFPAWRYTLVDLPTPMLEFARWRFRKFPNVELAEPGFGDDLPLRRAYDVITCLDVLEHVVNPLQIVGHIVEHLKPGGTLHVNFIDAPGGENLVESAAQRADTIAFLNTTLEPVAPLRVEVSDEVNAQYVKPRR